MLGLGRMLLAIGGLLSWSTMFGASTYASPLLDTRQSASDLPTGWVSVGCFSDSAAERTLRVASFTDISNMTIEACLSFCTPSNFNFAGVEFSRECYCDNVIESPGTAIDASDCNIACVGDSDEICGGSNAISIFQNTAIPPPPPPPSIKQSVGTFQYKGCFQDGVNGAARSLQNEITIAGGATAETCTAACQAAGFSLAGLEFGKECWCDSYFLFPTVTPDSDCNSVCDADDTELCGAGNRLAVYQDTTASIDTQACLSSTQLRNGFEFNLHTIATDGSGGSQFILGAFQTAATIGDPRNFFFLQIDPALTNEAHIFILSGSLIPANEGSNGTPIPIQPVPGGSQEFVSFSNQQAFTGYCAKPNPIPGPGAFFGPPVLSVSNQLLWGLCGQALIFSPPATANCTLINIELTPPVIF